MGLLKLAFDRQKKTLVNFDGSSTKLPPLYQSNIQPVRITIVEPSNGTAFRETYTAVDFSASELRVVIANSSLGGADTILAATYEAGWTWNADDDCFEGEINFDTAQVQALLEGKTHASAHLEINVITGSDIETIFGSINGQSNIIINANADDDASEAPSILTAPPTIGRVTLVEGATAAFTANVVAISGLGLAFTPSYYLLFVEAPNGYGAILANFVIGSGTSDGFSAVLSAVPEVDTYKLVYIPVE